MGAGKITMEKFPTAPRKNPENIYQQRDAFEDFAKHVNDAERRKPMPEEKERMDAGLDKLGKIFEGTGLRWHLDGALNISLMTGEYIGVHKDVDISVEQDELEKLNERLEQTGFGIFLSYPADPKHPEGKYVFERISPADILLERPGQVMIGAIDASGKIREEEPLNFPDLHVTKRNEEGKPMGDKGVELPEKWFEGYPVQFRDTIINLSHPAKVAYFKLHGTRDYDFTDLKSLAETGKLTNEDIADIEQALKGENILRRVAKNVRTGRSKKLEQLKKWVAESEIKN